MDQRLLIPIFVGGCDRSGTTYLASALARIPGVIALPESHFIAEGARRAQAGDYSVAGFLTDAGAHPRYGDWRGAGCSEPQDVAGEATSIAEAVSLLVRHFAARQGWPAPVAFIEQAPPNIHYAQALKAVFPSMSLLHIYRDGRAVAASWMPLDWGPNDVIDAAKVWRREVTSGFRAVKSLGPAARNVKYRELIENGDAAIRSLAIFCGVPPTGELKEKSKYAKPGYSARTHSLVGEKPDASRIDAWRAALTPRQKEIFEAMAGDLLADLGYALEHEEQARPPTLPERLTLKAIRGIRYRLNARRFNRRFSGR